MTIQERCPYFWYGPALEDLNDKNSHVEREVSLENNVEDDAGVM